MSVRCKLYVTSLETFSSPPKTGIVKMSAVYKNKPNVNGNACLENHVFGQYTPNATLQMNIQNPDAFAQFEPGKEFYVDFSPAPVEESA